MSYDVECPGTMRELVDGLSQERRSLSYGQLVLLARDICDYGSIFLARDILEIAERRQREEFLATHDAAVALRDLGFGGEFKLYRSGDPRVIGVIRIGGGA